MSDPSQQPETDGDLAARLAFEAGELLLALRADGLYLVGKGLHALQVVKTLSLSAEAVSVYTTLCADKAAAERTACERAHAELLTPDLESIPDP